MSTSSRTLDDALPQVGLDVRIETPENVVLTYQLAGPAQRGCAYLLDLAIRLGVVLALSMMLSMTAFAVPGLSLGLLLLVLFVIEWGYYVVSEGFFHGKSIGKHLLGLRVIQERGHPVTFWSAMIRNLIRAADAAPFYGPALLSMLVSKKLQRLGDLAAGTIVIAERRAVLPREPIILGKIFPLPREEFGRDLPAERTLTLIDRFLGRRHVLSHERGHAVAAPLARALARRLDYRGDPRLVEAYPMAFLARVYVTFLKSREAEDVPATPQKSPTNRRQFIRDRKPSWNRFADLVDRMDRSSRSRLGARQITEFSRLFRQLSHDLAIIRSRNWGNELASYLNDLVARGHNAFYSAPPGHLSRLLHFVAVGFPRLFRANVGYFLVAAALFFGPGAVSWAVIQTHPDLATRILPNEYLEQFDSMYGRRDSSTNGADVQESSTSEPKGPDQRPGRAKPPGRLRKGRPGRGFGEERAFMAGFYVYNNVGIALACFARGILLGVGTVYTLLFNGIFIGAVGGYVVSQGNAERFLSFVISHGSFELTAIAVAGGAGLMLGNALLHPGRRTRLEALRARGLAAVQIAAGAAVMLLVAALIEAFWSPAAVPAMWKYVVGSGLWLLVILYLTFAGRNR